MNATDNGARLLALVEQWRERERTLCRRADEAPTPQYGRQLADRAECYARCADELAVALRRLPPQLEEEKNVMTPDSSADHAKPPCALCGGPHPFDTSVPSVVWNRVVRAQGLPEYLCLTCIVRTFARVGESFTAELWGEWSGLPIEIRIGGAIAIGAAEIGAENTRLRARIVELEAAALRPEV